MAIKMSPASLAKLGLKVKRSRTRVCPHCTTGTPTEQRPWFRENCPRCNGTGIEMPGSRGKRAKAKKAPNADEHYRTMVRAACAAHGIPEPFFEYTFCEGRKWRFDLAWPKPVFGGVALEIEGGAFRGPGHRSVGVFLRNIEKYNEAAILCWKLLRCTTEDVESGSIWPTVKRAMGV